MSRFVSIAVAVLLVCGGLSLLVAQQMVTRDFTDPAASRDARGPEFWTAERRAAAIPMIRTISGSAAAGPMTPVGPVVSSPGQKATMLESPLDSSEVAVPGVLQPMEAGIFSSYPYPFTRYFPWGGLYNGNYAFYPIYPYRTVGKLFFTLGNTSYVCSASVIRPHLLLTARHCVLDASAGWASNVVFYPGYFNGVTNTRLKAWKARRMGTWSYAGTGAGLKWDIGFIQTYDDNNTSCGTSGHAIEYYTGFLGWMYGGYVGDRNYHAMGYPHAAPFNGLFMVIATSDVGNIDPLNQPGTFSIGNDMTGGSSGGPWLVDFGVNNYANGLNSYKWTNPNRPLEMNSPNFQQDNFYNLLAWAQGWSCP